MRLLLPLPRLVHLGHRLFDRLVHPPGRQERVEPDPRRERRPRHRERELQELELPDRLSPEFPG